MMQSDIGYTMERGVLLCLLLFCVCSCWANHPYLRLRRASDTKFNPKWNATKADELKRDLLLNYDKFTRPSSQSEPNATVVTFDPNIQHLELDEQTSILTIHAWIKMSWVDEKLKWDESEYGGLSLLHVADHEVWQPDLLPYNSAAGSAIDNYGTTHALVYSNGNVLWVPPSVLRVFCEIDLTKWPYDTQICPLKIGSWAYSGLEISLKYSDAKPEFANLLPNAEWKFKGMTRERNIVHYECCKEPYIDLVFKMEIERQSPSYKALIITPITAIVFMTLATFWLPAASTEKITLGASTAIIISLFLLYFTQKLAVMAGHTPLIVLFYSSSLYLVAISIAISVAVINLSSGPRLTPIPWVVKNHLSGWLGQVLLLQNFASQTSRLQHSHPKAEDDDSAENRPVFAEDISSLPEGQQGSGSSSHHDWRLLATAIDRICFIVYCLLFSCFALAYLT